ncbi:MAG: tRNA lysidine(34) synthetase TilS [Rhodothermales bacterium]|nr:tRNA lysidine(34) synthetase TilS [Rhodothermales bacterium]
MPDLIDHLREALEACGAGGGARLLVGVSGGVDSVVLLHALRRLGSAGAACHVNYGLRGAASDEDEAFVRALCAEWGLPLHVAARPLADAEGSVQEAARAARYAVFEEVARAEGIAAVAVGHHRDDQAETILMQLLRGAGPEGLTGMAPRRPLAPGIALVRPLLGVRRAAVEAYARAQGLRWREDASNRSLRYRRAALRTEVLPRIEAHFGPGAVDNIARSGTLLRAYVAASMQEQLEQTFSRTSVEVEGGGGLRLAELEAMPAVWRGRVILEALRRWVPGAARASVVDAAERLREAQPGRRVEAGGGVIWRGREALLFLQTPNGEEDAPQTLDARRPVCFRGGRLILELLDARPADLAAGAPNAVVLDADRLDLPLRVRRWLPGDRIRPLGLGGTKKVSDVLTDARVPVHQRSAVPVVLSGSEVVWVAGHRMAEAVRVRPETRRYAKITFIRGR